MDSFVWAKKCYKYIRFARFIVLILLFWGNRMSWTYVIVSGGNEWVCLCVSVFLFGWHYSQPLWVLRHTFKETFQQICICWLMNDDALCSCAMCMHVMHHRNERLIIIWTFDTDAQPPTESFRSGHSWQRKLLLFSPCIVFIFIGRQLRNATSL